MFTNRCPVLKRPKAEQDKILSNFDMVRIVSYGPAISQSDCRKADPYQYNNYYLLTEYAFRTYYLLTRCKGRTVKF